MTTTPEQKQSLRLPRTTKPHFTIHYTDGKTYPNVSLAYKAAMKWKDQLPPSHEIKTNKLPLFIRVDDNTTITFHFSNQ